jgi:hypothetical protein
MTFKTEKASKDAKGSLDAGFKKWGWKLSGAGKMESKITNTSQLDSHEGSYECDGWSKDHLPKLICTLEDLASSQDQVDPLQGRKMDAILCRYSACPGYWDARSAYFDSKDQADDYKDPVEVQPMSSPPCAKCVWCCIGYMFEPIDSDAR